MHKNAWKNYTKTHNENKSLSTIMSQIKASSQFSSGSITMHTFFRNSFFVISCAVRDNRGIQKPQTLCCLVCTLTSAPIVTRCSLKHALTAESFFSVHQQTRYTFGCFT